MPSVGKWSSMLPLVNLKWFPLFLIPSFLTREGIIDASCWFSVPVLETLIILVDVYLEIKILERMLLLGYYS